MTEPIDGRRVDVYVRAFEPIRDEHEEAVDRLKALSADGKIVGFSLQTWPNKVRVSERSICKDIVERYEQLDDWATAVGLSIHPPFELRETGYELLGEHDEVLILPAMFVVVTEGEDILGVYPCRAEGQRVGIDDCLAALESDGDLPP